MDKLRSSLHKAWKLLNSYRSVKKIEKKSIEKAFDKLGPNWNDDGPTVGETRPVFVFFGLPRTKRPAVADRLPQYRCAFAFGKTSASRQLSFLKKYPPARVCVAVHHGRASISEPVAAYLFEVGIPLSPYQDLEEFLDELQDVYRDKGDAFVEVELCGDIWLQKSIEPFRHVLFIGVPPSLHKSLIRFYSTQRCAFISNTLDETTGLSAFLSLFPPEKILSWNRERVDPALMNFLSTHSLTVEPLPLEFILRTMFVPCGESKGKSALLDTVTKPLAVLWGLDRAAESKMVPCMPQYRVVRLAPAMTLEPLEQVHDLVFLFPGDWRETSVGVFARRRNIPVIYVNEAILSRLGWRKAFSVPLFVSLSSTAPDILGLPKQLELTSRARECLNHIDGKALIQRLIELRRLALSGIEEPDSFISELKTVPFVLAIWHEEEATTIFLDDFLNLVVLKQSGKKVVCLCLQNGKIIDRSGNLKGALRHKCFFLNHAEDFDHLCPSAEVVYVVGSLYGLEALLYGRQVVTCGTPFYAGLGLTEDLAPQASRVPMTLSELTVCALASAPCRTPYSGEKLEPEQALALHHLRERSDFSYIFEWLQGYLGLDERHLFMETRVKFYHDDTETTAWLERSLRSSTFGAVLADLLTFHSKCEGLGALLPRLSVHAALLLFQALLIYCRTNVIYDLYADIVRQYVQWFEDRSFRDFETLDFYDQYLTAEIGNRFRDIGKPPSFRINDKDNLEMLRQMATVYSRILLKACRYKQFEIFFNSLPILSEDYYLEILQELMTDPIAYREPAMEKRLELRLCLFHVLLSIIGSHALPPWGKEMVALAEAWLREDLATVSSLTEKLRSSMDNGGAAPTGQALSLLSRMFNTYMQGMNYHHAEAVLSLLERAQGLQAWANQRRHLIQIESTPFPSGMLHKLRKVEMEKNLESLQAARRKKNSIGAIWTSSRNYALEKLYQETSSLMARTPQPSKPDGYIFLHHFGMHISSILPLVINSLAVRNFATIPLSTGHVYISSQCVSGPHRFAYSIPYGNGELSLDWQVDFPNRKVSALGINFFDRFHELLTVTLRKYDIDWEAPITRRFFNRLLYTSDVHLRCCHEIYQEIRKSGVKACVLLDFPYVPPQAVWLDYAMHVNDPHFRLIYYCPGNLTLDQGTLKEIATVAAVDMTLHSGCRVPFLPPEKKFKVWYQNFQACPDFSEEVEKIRSGLEMSAPKDSLFYGWLKEEKAKGKRIVCCYGRLLYDRCLRKDGGPGHENMIDWLLHSIEVASHEPEMLLLVKPHPDEANCSYSCSPLQQLKDILPDPLPDNVVCLPPTVIKTPQLKGLIDMAALWLGTAAYELTALGVPVVVCSNDGLGEIPFHVLCPSNRDDYAAMLRGLNCPPPIKEQIDEAAAYIKYIGMEEVVKPYPYSFVSTSNDFTTIPYYDREAVERYFRDGDSYIEQIVDQILEGFKEDKP